jgi:hypothetical protein
MTEKKTKRVKNPDFKRPAPTRVSRPGMVTSIRTRSDGSERPKKYVSKSR